MQNIGKIANGESIEVLIGERGASSATIIDCYSQKNSINTKMSTFNLQEQISETYNMQVPELESVNYENSDLSIDINFKEEKENDKYNTIAIIKITNKTNKKLNNLIFNLDYKDTNNYFSEITTSSLNQTLTHTQGSSYKLFDYDYINENSFKIYQISGFISDERFTGFSISNVKYDFEQINNTNENDTVKDIINNTVSNAVNTNTNIDNTSTNVNNNNTSTNKVNSNTSTNINNTNTITNKDNNTTNINNSNASTNENKNNTSTTIDNSNVTTDINNINTSTNVGNNNTKTNMVLNIVE